MFDALNVVDLDTMKVKKRLRLGFKPRAIQADYKRDLLIIGGWLNGNITSTDFQLSKKLHEPLPVARYMRNFAYDDENGILFCACLRGLYEINVEMLIRDNKNISRN